MTYSNFLEEVQAAFSQKLDASCTVTIQPVIKNNGLSYDGLSVFHPKQNLSPTIYLNPYYARYLDGVPLADIIDDIYSTYTEHVPQNSFPLEDLFSFSCARDHIVPKLINAGRNRELLEKLPYVSFLNLAIVFQYLLELPDEGTGSVLINHEMLRNWNKEESLTTEDLYRLSLQNAPDLLPFEMIRLSTYLKNMAEERGCLTEEQRQELEEEAVLCPMYMLTNTDKCNGAAVVLYPGILKRLAENFGSDLILLPSSIHEFIVYPSTSEDIKNEARQLNCLVREVNESEVADGEVLSDYAYYYDRKKGAMEMAG